MSFESVYRVSARNSIPGEDEFKSLSQALNMGLPAGYREYVTTFGPGTLCTFLIVRMPGQLRCPDRCDELARMRLADAATDFDNVARLNAAEYDCAKVFAYASAEAPIWFSTPTQGVRLFEYAEGRTCEIENGFIGLVERCTVGQEHDFPFFEPNNGRRRMRQLYIRPGVGRTGFADALARRWGRDTVRCSRNSPDDLHPTYFVSAIEAYIELSLGPKQGIPSDSFFVRASYDVDSEVDFSAFVEPLLLPGGGPYESLGEPFWFG